ncbi:MAG TPA: nitroreductase family protein [Planctomycetota bacterium]|jgi:nitroreductase
MDAIEALKTRRSVRTYKSDPVPRKMLDEIVDCGRLAASARNVQPWEFVVVTDAAMRQKVAQATEANGAFISQAPACIVVFCDTTTYFLEDGSAATQNILVAARAMGLGSCWIAGDKKPYADKVREILGVPPKMKLIALVALGYTNETPAPLKRALKEVVHWEKW